MTALVVLAGVALCLFPRRSAPRSLVPALRLDGAWSARRWRRRDDRAAMPLVLELLARELRAGATVLGAISTVAATEPAGASLQPVVDRVARGARVADELDRWAAAHGSADAHLARSVLRLGLLTGAALADSLDGAAATMRDRSELDAELRALTAQSRASAMLLAVAPVGFLVVLGSTAPDLVAPLVTTPFGWGCLVVGIALDAVGFWWMRRLVDGVDT